jgi:glycosyltransferase involved in cell wall biosynthesis
VICAFADERWTWLEDAVRSIRVQSVPAREIIVVIDHNDRLLDRVMHELPDVVALANDGDRGAGGARNVGVEAASGSIVAFLDDDAQAVPRWIEYMLGPLASPGTLGVGGEVAPNWETSRPPWFPPEFDWVIGCSYRGLPTAQAPVRNLMAGNMALRRDVFSELGGYRHGHGNVQMMEDQLDGAKRRRFVTRQSGCEETEFCIRGLQHWPGSVWLYHPEVRIHHWVPAARVRWQYFMARCFDEGLAKATVVVRFAGQQDGLATERSYVARTLTRGIVRGALDSLGGDLWGLGRAGAIMVGGVITAIGYLRGRLAVAFAPSES